MASTATMGRVKSFCPSFVAIFVHCWTNFRTSRLPGGQGRSSPPRRSHRGFAAVQPGSAFEASTERARFDTGAEKQSLERFDAAAISWMRASEACGFTGPGAQQSEAQRSDVAFICVYEASLKLQSSCEILRVKRVRRGGDGLPAHSCSLVSHRRRRAQTHDYTSYTHQSPN